MPSATYAPLIEATPLCLLVPSNRFPLSLDRHRDTSKILRAGKNFSDRLTLPYQAAGLIDSGINPERSRRPGTSASHVAPRIFTAFRDPHTCDCLPLCRAGKAGQDTLSHYRLLSGATAGQIERSFLMCANRATDVIRAGIKAGIGASRARLKNGVRASASTSLKPYNGP